MVASDAYHKDMDKKANLNPDEVLEGTYLSLTMIKLANKKMYNTVMGLMDEV